MPHLAKISPFATPRPSGLIVVLQHGWVMFHRVDGPQFDGVAFKLNGASHLARGIGATDMGGTRLHTTRWRRGAHPRQELTGVRRQAKTTTPQLKLRWR